MSDKKLNITSQGISSIFVSNGNVISGDLGNQKCLNNFNSPDRPVTVRELFSKLDSRDWNMQDRVFINKDRKLQISEGSSNSGFSDTGTYSITLESERTREKPTPAGRGSIESCKKIHKKVVKLFKDMEDKNSKYLFESSKISFDILNDSVTLDLIDSGQYTNTLSLVNLFKKVVGPNVAAKVDLSIKYSKNGVLSSHNMVFEAFCYPSDPEDVLKYTGSDFTRTVNNDIVVEYIDNTIRLVPINPDIDECIISNCTVTYGNL